MTPVFAEPRGVEFAPISFVDPDSNSGSPANSQSKLAVRRHDRINTSLTAVLYTSHSFQITVVRDVSPGGARLEKAAGVLPGDMVNIKLVTGHSKTAIVRWWFNGSCGIAFDEPLHEGDPFLQRAIRNARKMADTVGPGSRKD
jgi:PilZ domain